MMSCVEVRGPDRAVLPAAGADACRTAAAWWSGPASVRGVLRTESARAAVRWGLVSAVFLSAGLAVPVAHAEVLPAAYGGSADAAIASVATSLVGGPSLAGVDLATVRGSVDSGSTPRSIAVASNLDAAVAGLEVQPQRLEQQAPPDNQTPAEGTLLGVEAAGIDLEALDATALARWPGDDGCLDKASAVATATATTAALTVDLAGVRVAQALTAATTGAVDAADSGDLSNTRTVTSEASATLARLDLIDGRVQVAAVGEARLTARATGRADGATVDYVAPPVTVTVDGVTARLEPGVRTQVNVPGVAEVGLTLGTPATVTTDPAGTAASAQVTFLAIDAVLLGPLGAPLGSVQLDLFPLAASASTSTGDVQCDGSLDAGTSVDGTGTTEPVGLVAPDEPVEGSDTTEVDPGTSVDGTGTTEPVDTSGPVALTDADAGDSSSDLQGDSDGTAWTPDDTSSGLEGEDRASGEWTSVTRASRLPTTGADLGLTAVVAAALVLTGLGLTRLAGPASPPRPAPRNALATAPRLSPPAGTPSALPRPDRPVAVVSTPARASAGSKLPPANRGSQQGAAGTPWGDRRRDRSGPGRRPRPGSGGSPALPTVMQARLRPSAGDLAADRSLAAASALRRQLRAWQTQALQTYRDAPAPTSWSPPRRSGPTGRERPGGLLPPRGRMV